MRYGNCSTYTGSLRDWRLEQALWAYWCRDMEDCYRILTRVCNAEVTEDYDDEQEEITAY